MSSDRLQLPLTRINLLQALILKCGWGLVFFFSFFFFWKQVYFLSLDELWFREAINHFPIINGILGLETLLPFIYGQDDLARWQLSTGLASGRLSKEKGSR